MNSEQAQSIIMNIIGGQYEERWPEEERNAIFSTAEFSYDQRMEVGTFLFGNLRDINLVFAAVRPQFGADPTHVDHFKRFLADLASGTYDRKYHYFDVLKADWFFLDGALNARRSPPSPFACALHAWEALLFARAVPRASRGAAGSFLFVPPTPQGSRAGCY